MSYRVLVLLGGLVAIFWASRQWRKAIQAALLLLVFEGAVRKWLLPGAQDLVYFGKDVLLLGAYAGFLSKQEHRRFLPPIPPLLTGIAVLAAAYGLFQVVNPNLPTPLLGAIGWKAYFLYVPLLWVVPAAFSDDREVAVFLKRHLLLVLPIGILAFAQFLSPPDSRLNMYARSGSQQWVTTFGSANLVRVTGTFSYITGFSSYLLATGLLLLGVLGSSGLRLRNRGWALVALGTAFACMLMTGSRGPVFLLLLVLPIYWVLVVARIPGAVASSARLVGLVLIVGAVVAYVAPEARVAFLERAAGSDTSGRFGEPFLAPLRAYGVAGFLGFGIGATHQAASAVVRTVGPPYWLHGILIEAEPGRVMLELGPVGFLLVYGLRFMLLVTLFRSVLEQTSRFRLGIAAACATYVLSQSLGAVYDPTASLYYWFVAGLGLALWTIDLRERQRTPVRAEALQRSQPSLARAPR